MTLRGVPRRPAGQLRRVRRAIQHHSDQRHGVLPRSRRLGVPPRRRDPPSSPPAVATRSGSGVRAAHPGRRPTRWPCCWRTPWTPTRSGNGQDLRHRHRRGRTHRGARRVLRREGRGIGAARLPRAATSSTSATAATSSSKDLRRAVIFGRNDLVKDAPISRVDLLVVPQHPDVPERGTQRTCCAACISHSRRGVRCSSATPRCC